MRLELPTHTINYTNGVNYKIPIYWELWKNGQMIKNTFGINGGMYNDIAQDNYNNHPEGSSIEAEVGFTNVYTFKFWHLGTINLPIMLIMFAANSTNTNTRSGMYDGDKAFAVQMGEYKQFDFILVNNPLNWVKINCNAGFILADGSFTYNIPAPISLKDIVGGDDGLIIPKLATRLRDNVLIEWYNISTGIATGARIPNSQQIAGINNPFYSQPIIVTPPTNNYYNFNAGDYYDVNKNPSVRSPITFLVANKNIALNPNNLLKRYPTKDFLSTNSTNLIQLSKNTNGYLNIKIEGGSSALIMFKNPVVSKAGLRIKGKMPINYSSTGLITIKSNSYEAVESTTIANNLDRIIDYQSSANVEYIYLYIEQTSLIVNEIFAFEFSAEFYSENTGEIIEPFIYKEDEKLYFGDELVSYALFETYVSTTNISDLSEIIESAWQPTNIITIPSFGVYFVYGRFTLTNGEKKSFLIRSFTQS